MSERRTYRLTCVDCGLVKHPRHTKKTEVWVAAASLPRKGTDVLFGNEDGVLCPACADNRRFVSNGMAPLLKKGSDDV